MKKDNECNTIILQINKL